MPKRCLHLISILILILPSLTRVTAQQSPTLPDAFAAWQQGNLVEATQILETIIEQQPEHAFAWLYLGRVRQSNKQLQQAQTAFKKAATFPATAGQATYNLGILLALQGKHDQAFDYLFQARDSANVDVTAIGLTQGIDSLKQDPRYDKLFPTEAEYADPFVEPVRVIREWRGEAAGDQFGWIARNIGDVDGDGVADVTTSAPTNSEAGAAAGKIYVYSSRTGELIWSASGNEKAQLGLGIEAAGDVNADGIPDVLAGAPGENKAYAYSGEDGAILLTLSGEADGDFYGRKVSDAGDWNDDGHADVLIGAPGNDENGEDAGSAYLYSGKDGSLLRTWRGEEAGDRFGSSAGGDRTADRGFIVVGAPGAGQQNTGSTYVYTSLSDEPFFIIEADSTGAALGAMFVSVVGDINADSVPDIYASDWSNSALGRSTGRIYVHSGADGSRLLKLTGEAAGDGFGIGVADAGDVNKDGHDDLIIGAWQHSSAAPSGGKCYLYSGKDGALLQTYTGKVTGETLGFDATGMGDVDGDGAIDLLVTSAWSAVNGSRSGRVFIVSGKVTAESMSGK